jgi:hypothetical protein
MMHLSLTAAPEDHEEATIILSMLSTALQSLAFKGISATLAVTTYDDGPIEEQNEG